MTRVLSSAGPTDGNVALRARRCKGCLVKECHMAWRFKAGRDVVGRIKMEPDCDTCPDQTVLAMSPKESCTRINLAT